MKELSIYTSLGKGTIEERMTAIKNAGFNTVCLDFEKEILHMVHIYMNIMLKTTEQKTDV